MKKVRWGLRFLCVCVVAFAMGIVTGFVKNNIGGEKEMPDDVGENAQIVIGEEETLFYALKAVEHYFVVSEGDYIYLTEVFNDSSENVIETVEINKSVLPISDIMLLEEGLTFSDKDEALMMIENFVS